MRGNIVEFQVVRDIVIGCDASAQPLQGMSEGHQLPLFDQPSLSNTTYRVLESHFCGQSLLRVKNNEFLDKVLG